MQSQQIPDNLAIGDEPISEVYLTPEREMKEHNARKSHQDGSHAYRRLTWIERFNQGCLMLNMMGDVE